MSSILVGAPKKVDKLIAAAVKERDGMEAMGLSCAIIGWRNYIDGLRAVRETLVEVSLSRILTLNPTDEGKTFQAGLEAAYNYLKTSNEEKEEKR